VEQQRVGPDAHAQTALTGRWWILFVLTLVYGLNVVDRYLLGILLPQIKAELSLPDWSLGVLSGFAFAVFYATLGLPIARLADRHSRKTIISACLALFSAATAVCGFASSFLTLFLARIGVGIGEAGTGPASYSMISDLFEKARRSTAMAIYAIGGNLGLLIGFAAGGYMAANYGWRSAFFIIGAPGILVALLVFFTVRDPARGAADGLAPNAGMSSTMVDAFKFLWSQPAFRWIVIGSTLVQFLGTGVVNWLPSMLERSHGMVEDEVGIKLGLAIGIAGSIGTLVLGGLVADRLSKRDLRWGLWLLVIGELLLIPGYALVLLAPTGDLAISAFFLPAMLATFFMGPVLALTQALAPPDMRATAGALLMFIISLIGAGLGPVAVGLLSDLLNPSLGQDGLRAALWLAPVAAGLAAIAYAMAARTLIPDIARAEGTSPQ
jgi:MFS family permease